MKITGDETLLTISENYPQVITLFAKHGLGDYFKQENLNKLGRFLKLNTLLKSSNLKSEHFLNTLNTLITNHQVPNTATSKTLTSQLDLLAMLPCGLRNPFKDYLEKHLLENKEVYTNFNYLAEGNVNHELSYYPLLDSIESSDDLPDIIIASDVNNFFHQPFQKRFLSKGIFETYSPYTPNGYLEKVGYADPGKNFTMLTANMLVMVVDKSRLGSRKMPEKWEDILSPQFQNDIIMRGEDDFFCNAVMLPFYKESGDKAIKSMAKNIKSGKHPSEMVKLVGSEKEEAATVYIMPYFFAKRIKSSSAQIIWPEDGAIASPVFMIVKKKATQKHRKLLEFLLSKETAEMLNDRLFPAIHPEMNYSNFPQSIKWLGWDFLNSNDIGKLKEDIQSTFVKTRQKHPHNDLL